MKLSLRHHLRMLAQREIMKRGVYRLFRMLQFTR